MDLQSQKSYDPRMHTAEHILNQTMIRLFDCGRSHNSHIEKKKSKCDYRLATAPDAAQLASIEQQVNEVIARQLPVTEAFYSRAEAADRFFMGKVPTDAGDIIRVISVGQYDHCPCIGPHVQNTAEIGRFKLLSHDYAEGILRLRFKVETR